MYSIYILYSQEYNRYYTGSCKGVEKRLKEHNQGCVKSTKAFKPWKIVYSEQFETRGEARKREDQIKRYKGGEAFKSLLRKNMPL
jgi:putative endonuclease